MFQTILQQQLLFLNAYLLARSWHDSNKPRAHTIRMDKWNNTCMGRAANEKQKEKLYVQFWAFWKVHENAINLHLSHIFVAGLSVVALFKS